MEKEKRVKEKDENFSLRRKRKSSGGGTVEKLANRDFSYGGKKGRVSIVLM